jgi:HEAT repeat protein
MENNKRDLTRKQRGEVDSTLLESYSIYPDEKLNQLLSSGIAYERAVAATILGERKAKKYVLSLCNALKTEKALYARLAICGALVNIAEESVKPLLAIIGRVGNNQETMLPEKYFRKKSYPLTRDIVSRTLIRIGQPAVDDVINQSNTTDNYILSQIIDTLGGLLHYTKDFNIWPVLVRIQNENKGNDFLLWKTIRALSAIRYNETFSLILPYLKHKQAAIRWECIRTLGLSATNVNEATAIIKPFLSDSNPEIKSAANDAINRIGKYKPC